MNKFTEMQGNTIIKRILEGRLNYYDETIIVTKNLSVVMDAVAYIEQLRIELKETKTLLNEAYDLIQNHSLPKEVEVKIRKLINEL